MKRQVAIVAISAVAAMAAAPVAYGAEILNASASDRGTQSDSTVAASVAAIKCLGVSGAERDGITPKCRIDGPGFVGYVGIGQTVGTTGGGSITLTCSGTRGVGRTLSCSAAVDESACEDTESLSAYHEGGGRYGDSSPLFSQAVATCTSASGARRGSTARCFVDGPGQYGQVDVGETVALSGPGTVFLHCSGSYSANSTLSCAARVEQMCP